jgi:hypothetical protein
MRFVVDLSPDMVDAISRLIKQGRYRSVQDFLFAAAQNQLYDVEQARNVVTIQSRDPISASPFTTARLVHPISADLDYHLLVAPDLNKVQTLAPPESKQVAGEIYGLWNRFFPVKITTRVLANMLKGDGSSIPLDALQESASSIAREYGRMLIKKEQSLGRKRQDMIAVALPTKSRRSVDEFKAKARFKSHFVGYLNKNRIEGAPATLRFVNILKGDNGQVMIALTTAGLEFASLTNPVIDQEDFNSSLSDQERKFLTKHISAELPEEAKLMRFTLKAIKGGATSPEALQKELKKLKPGLKEAELVTLRSGLLSRMSELRMLTRTRNGLLVDYQVMSEGESFLTES